ncbi:major facilitator superfamily domain-containing protein [Polychytrium aggregatum]|uniref:major facilitator superfamily domain-containing protein n=1 Tax=Polychytrium aggregatum TaxID=110093 RepID=UPI0022FE444D|nr:major facilitator superfamily domain-containing protein [Polychytrium aggregatum]KAI9207567.1 major facilitator superfamily domain-containing protein [Polychytrium aggregatum]
MHPDITSDALRIVLVAPMAALSVLLLGPPLQQFTIQQVCSDYYADPSHSAGTLVDGTRDCSVSAVQKQAATVLAALQLLSAVPGFFVTLLSGHLSDKFGRKPMFYLAISGLCAEALLVFTASKLGGIDLLYAAKFCVGITGGLPTMISTSVSTLVDLTARKGQLSEGTNTGSRIAVMSWFDGGILIGMVIGSFAGGALVKWGGFQLCFFVATIWALAALLAMVLVVPETHPPSTGRGSTAPLSSDGRPSSESRSSLALPREDRNPWEWLKHGTEFFGGIPAAVIANKLLMAMMFGGHRVVFVIYAFKMFAWDTWADSLYLASELSLSALLLVSVVPSLDRFLRSKIASESTRPSRTEPEGERSHLVETAESFDDGLETHAGSARGSDIGISASVYQIRLLCTATLVALVCTLFATKSWVLYAVLPLTCLGIGVLSITKALINEYIPSDRVGVVNSVIATLTSVCDTLSAQISIRIFHQFVDVHPASVYVYFIGLTLAAIIATFFIVRR